MRRVGALFVTGVVLVGSGVAGCATSEPVGRAGASAPPSQSSQADVESGAATPEPSLSNSPTSPSAPAQESTGNVETPWPASGSSLRPVKAPRPAGVSLSELVAMPIDPLEEIRKAGIGIRTEYPYQMTGRNSSLLGPWNFGSPPPGLVLGYSRSAGVENCCYDDHMEGERGEYAPSLSASVWAFDSKAHAREYVESLAPNILEQADQPVRAALPAAGNGAVLWRSGSGRHFRDLALIRRGNLVGEVRTAGFTTDGHGEAIEPLARALADQMAQVKPRARPYDAAAVLAAPLPIDAWAALGEDRSSYPELVDCEDSSSLCEVESIVWGASWRDAPADRSALHLGPPDDDAQAEYPVTGTELIAYNSASAAADAMSATAARWLAREGGEQFTVPGIPGAVGVRTGTPYDLEDDDLVGYTWSVFFTHGSALARAFVAGGPTDDEDFEDPADSERNRQWAIDAAHAWQPRLDVLLV